MTTVMIFAAVVCIIGFGWLAMCMDNADTLKPISRDTIRLWNHVRVNRDEEGVTRVYHRQEAGEQDDPPMDVGCTRIHRMDAGTKRRDLHR